MKSSLWIAGAAGLCVTFAITAASRASDESAKKIASALSKKAAVKFFDERKFEFRDAGLEGVAKAVDPKEHIKVTIGELHVFEHYVLVSLKLEARFEFRGKLKKGDQTVDVTGKADVVHSISARADFREDNDKLVVRARVTRLELEPKLRELTPADLPDGKQRIESLLKKNKDKLLKEVNDWVTKNEIETD